MTIPVARSRKQLVSNVLADFRSAEDLCGIDHSPRSFVEPDSNRSDAQRGILANRIHCRPGNPYIQEKTVLALTKWLIIGRQRFICLLLGPGLRADDIISAVKQLAISFRDLCSREAHDLAVWLDWEAAVSDIGEQILGYFSLCCVSWSKKDGGTAMAYTGVGKYGQTGIILGITQVDHDGLVNLRRRYAWASGCRCGGRDSSQNSQSCFG